MDLSKISYVLLWDQVAAQLWWSMWWDMYSTAGWWHLSWGERACGNDWNRWNGIKYIKHMISRCLMPFHLLRFSRYYEPFSPQQPPLMHRSRILILPCLLKQENNPAALTFFFCRHWYIFCKGKSSLKFPSRKYKTSEAFLNLKYTTSFKGPSLQESSLATGWSN